MKRKYQLHAVSIHDGSAESGHYYTIIKDHSQNIWREVNDIRVKVVDEETVFEQSNGGCGLKTAYWLVYISDALHQQYTKLNINEYDPSAINKNVTNHIYGKRIPAPLLSQQDELNKKLRGEVDDFKNSEAANKVTSLYDRRLAELTTVIDSKDKNKDLANFYVNLFTKEMKDTSKRLLIDQCFFETQNVRRQQAERSEGIIMKIDEKSKGRPTYPQDGKNWISGDEMVKVTEAMTAYQERFLNTFIQAQVFG